MSIGEGGGQHHSQTGPWRWTTECTHLKPPYRYILGQKMTGQVHGVVELWGDWRRRPLLTPKRPKLQNFAPPTWKIHNLWGVGETMSLCLEKIQAKFDRLGLKYLGPAWRGYNCQTARAAHRSDDIPCAGMAHTQGASMGGFGGPMWVYNVRKVVYI